MAFPIVNISPRSLPHSPRRPDPVQGIQQSLEPWVQKRREERARAHEIEMGDMRHDQAIERQKIGQELTRELHEEQFERQRPFMETPEESFQRRLQGDLFGHRLSEMRAQSAHERELPLRERALGVQEGHLGVAQGQLGLSRDRFGLQQQFDPALGGTPPAAPGGVGADYEPSAQLRGALFGRGGLFEYPGSQQDPDRLRLAEELIRMDQGIIPEAPAAPPPGTQQESTPGLMGRASGWIRDRLGGLGRDESQVQPGAQPQTGTGQQPQTGQELQPQTEQPATPPRSQEEIGALQEQLVEDGIRDFSVEDHVRILDMAPDDVREIYLDLLDPDTARAVEGELRGGRR